LWPLGPLKERNGTRTHIGEYVVETFQLLKLTLWILLSIIWAYPGIEHPHCCTRL
jgi:hypothetical protein